MNPPLDQLIEIFNSPEFKQLLLKKYSDSTDNNSVMGKIYKLSIDKPTLGVAEILKELNIGYNTYRNLCKTHDSIPKYRKRILGQSIQLSEERKAELTNNLTKYRENKKQSTNMQPIEEEM